jgi:16S rRNA (adenine1518-N6/adenine1519-N6)-dimethyltransferase
MDVEHTMSVSETREAAARLGLQPSKALGQNFLIDGNILRLILKEADLRPNETVLEIGPGLGALTRLLVAHASHLIAVERDARLAAYLRAELPALNLVEADAVEWLRRPDTLAGFTPPFKVVSNLPYSVASPIIEALVEGEPKPRMMVLTVQREVAERLASTPRHKDYGAMTLFTQLRYHVTIAHIISPRCFWPAPNVDSAVVVLDRREPRVPLATGAPFHELVRAGFAHRRKMLRKLLCRFEGVEAAFASLEIPTNARAEELSLDQWILLANELAP